ncbi:MAG: glycosyltransferase [Anaerolineae bacterium]|nr:glycosyltransferase [Anaerolineae bacterium]
MTRYCLIGPTYPYRGGIAHYTTLLTQHLHQEHEVLLISFSRQYPRWLFPGRDDRDPSLHPLQAEAEYLLDSLNPLSWWRTWRRIRQWQAEVVIIPWWVPFWAPVWGYLSWGIKQRPHPPRLLFICHNVLPHEPGRLDKLALRLALSRGDGYIVHSQADEAQLQAIWPQARVQVTPLPTYKQLGQNAAAPPPIPLPTDRPILLFFGFVRPYKGLDVLLEALPLVLADCPVHLLIVGEFWQGVEKYREQIERLGLRPHLTIIDRYVPDEELVAYVQRANAAILPYRSATQSAVVQVALGHGCPVITTAVGGLAEAVQDGVTGLVVPAGDVAGLAAAIQRYFSHNLEPIFRTNIQQQTGNFSWTRLERAINQLCQSPSSSPA